MCQLNCQTTKPACAPTKLPNNKVCIQIAKQQSLHACQLKLSNSKLNCQTAKPACAPTKLPNNKLNCQTAKRACASTKLPNNKLKLSNNKVCIQISKQQSLHACQLKLSNSKACKNCQTTNKNAKVIKLSMPACMPCQTETSSKFKNMSRPQLRSCHCDAGLSLFNISPRGCSGSKLKKK